MFLYLIKMSVGKYITSLWRYYFPLVILGPETYKVLEGKHFAFHDRLNQFLHTEVVSTSAHIQIIICLFNSLCAPKTITMPL